MNTEELIRDILHKVVVPDQDKLWTAKDIGKHLDVSPRTVSEKIAMQPGFPRPLKLGVKRWYMVEVLDWARANRDR